MKYLGIALFGLIFYQCSSDAHSSIYSDEMVQNRLENNNDTVLPPLLPDKSSCVDSVFRALGLVNIQAIDSSIQMDLKYATTDNFMHQQLYFTIEQLYLQKDVAIRLSKAQQTLKKIHPTWSLLVFDGVRPVDVQQRMWDALDSIPPAERGKFVSNPKNHSVHNYGAAIDLTIVDENRQQLDMGTGYDDIRKLAYPSLEAQFLATGELTQQQVNNRKLLRKVMAQQGFLNIPSEWWHFNAYKRDEVKQRYQVVLQEPKCE
ncbi:MAG: M15 family metallopeptidase [Crocinitomicaceae bacterium]|nr:M15 family metallopeptidase [Crocinitomicaceae bacterium]